METRNRNLLLIGLAALVLVCLLLRALVGRHYWHCFCRAPHAQQPQSSR